MVFNIDPRIHDRVRLSLHHVSTVTRADFSEALKLCMELIWRRVYCDEVRVSLVHLKNAEGKQVVDTELRDVLKVEQRFKWKTLTNEDGKRKLIMAVERSAVDLAFENPRGIVPQREPLLSRGLVVLSVDSRQCSRGSEEEKRELTQLENVCSWLNALKEKGNPELLARIYRDNRALPGEERQHEGAVKEQMAGKYRIGDVI